jgi:AAHS family 4-hydroxybenzoate transporter-like MFS transporter
MADRRTTDLSEIIEQQKLTPFIVRLVLLSWIITFFDGFDVSVLSFVAPDLSAALHINRLTLGNVFGVGQAGMVAGGLLFGYLGDRIGRRTSIILATTLFGAFSLAIALSGSYVTLLALRLIEGIAMGGLLPLAWALNIEYMPRRFRSTVVTLIMVGYSIGSSSAGPMTILLTPRYGWRSLFVVGGCAGMVGTGLLILFLPESLRFLSIKNKHPELLAAYARQLAPGRTISTTDRFVISDEGRAPAKKFSVSMLFRNELRWITPLIWIAYATSSIAVFFGSSWGPTILQLVGFNRSTAALTASLNAVAGALGGLLLMRFVDRRGASSIAIFPALTIPILLAMGFSGIGGRGFLVLYFFGSMCVIGAHYGVMSIAGIFYPSAYRSNGTGWASSVGKIGSIVGPMLGGIALSSRLPVKLVFAMLAVCPFVVAACVLAIGRLQRQLPRIEKAQPWDEAGALLRSEVPAHE